MWLLKPFSELILDRQSVAGSSVQCAPRTMGADKNGSMAFGKRGH